MSEKNVNARIIHKHDLEVNWLKATNFIPKQGELIIYDIEIDANGNTLELPTGRTEPYAYTRFKIGNGVANINYLPFTNTQVQIITWEDDD